ncbi:Imm8 family immunity protein [uncultured Bartonella sp.]|uniref:Imm8 family immunity protein n=1 Tax=uncultured Bartonella sp. TaxID=104108 RepID=UPI003427A164
MRAILKRLYSPDIYNLESYIPPEEENFCFLLQAMIGPLGGDGEESFDIEVFTPMWLYNN